MTTSTPPAWNFLEEKYVPVSIDALNLSVSDTLRERNDSNPDPTYQDCWPSERYPSDGPDRAGVQSVRERHTNLSVGAQNEHPAWVCIDCGHLYGKSNGVATWHLGTCGICGREMAVTEPRDFGNRNYNDPTCTVTAPETTSPADSFHETASFTQGENGADVEVDSCPECGAVTDIEYGAHFEPAKIVDRISDRISDTIDDNPLLNHMERTFNSCMDIAVAKNEGYAGNADPMANFNDSVRLGVPVPIGVALRLSDKWARLCRLLQTGENPLADESITDTIMDAVNYLAILLYAMGDEGDNRIYLTTESVEKGA